MIRPETLALPPLHVSLEPTLGDYYQDLSPALALVESGYHGGVDDDGVPVAAYGEQGRFHNPTIIAQYALASLIALRRGERARAGVARTQLDWLVGAQASSGALAGCWTVGYDDPKYPWLRAPWTSALSSGSAISALLRGWEQFGEARYRAAATAAYRALHERRPGPVLCDERGGELWYEEYPADPPLRVLNGHAYALLGVADHARVSGDPEATARWRHAAATLAAHLDGYDLGFWSAYDLREREPASRHYHSNIHLPLLRILATLTGEPAFTRTAKRWERYAASPTARARWQVALRTQRWRRTEGRPAHEPARTALRSFPYPFRAALALSNDADLLTPERFRRLQRFLSTAEATDWGPGLSLNVGGSFFMFRSPDSPNELTVFDRLGRTVTPAGEYLLECARRGVIDVLHTYGCFTDPADFNRSLAEVALDALRSRGITIETWVNHGAATNVQCIGTRPEWEGDLSGSAAYHADLTVAHGVRWVWTGLEATDRIALDGDGLVVPYVLRDGGAVRRFLRYGGLSGRTPVLDDLPAQLAGDRLDRLVDAGAYAIVYQHLAVRRRRPGFGPGAYGPVEEDWFRPPELAALRELARRHHDGELWVAPTTTLLRYHDVHHAVRWRSEPDEHGERIFIDGDAQNGWRGPLRAGDLAGLTFYCGRPETARIVLASGGRHEPVAPLRANPFDATGRRSVTVLGAAAPAELP